jgi:oxygen-independent coproporphyrinogen III oxidase
MFGLYLHIPFCRFMCHYCDFAKTANWNSSHIEGYLKELQTQVKTWILFLKENQEVKIDSVFLGGGTPSIVSSEYQGVFSEMSKYLSNDCEITLESNPEDLTEENLVEWRRLGINRLSVGIQTFSKDGLSFLTRRHSAKQTISKIKLAKKYFDNISCDLIYGWPNQTIKDLSEDLQIFLDLELKHLSLYSLIYEAKTPIGRAQKRGKITEASDIHLEKLYLCSQDFLSKSGFEQYELANWCKRGYESRHNQKYWNNDYYLSVGSGAHGYLPSAKTSIGMRYSYNSNPRVFIKNSLSRNDLFCISEKFVENPLAKAEKRSEEQWLIEYVSSSVRTKKGISLKLIEQTIGKVFCPSSFVLQSLDKKTLSIENSYIKLASKEWFRENSWALEILECF